MARQPTIRVRGRRRLPLRPLTVLVVAMTVCSALLTSVLIRRIGDEQEQRQHEQRTAAAVAVLETSMRQVDVDFGFLATSLTVGADPLAGFRTIAAAVTDDHVRAVGVATAAGGAGFRPQVSLGEGPDVGRPLSGEWTALLERAATAAAMVTGVLPSGHDIGATVVGAARAVDGTDLVMFMQFAFDPPNEGTDRETDPFADLATAIYVGPDELPTHLMLTTADELPLRGDVVRMHARVGDDEWLVVTRAIRPLVGGVASWAPLAVAGGGVALALLVGVLIEILGRRRAYAQRLVDERTAELRGSLAVREQLEASERAAREAAEAANQSKSEFLSRMSHELRTPLNAILGFGQLLELEPLPDDLRDPVAQILKGGHHLLALINEVLDIARIDGGHFSLSPEPVLAAELLEEVAALMRPLADEQRIQLVVDRSQGVDCYAFADHQRAKQILLNLVSNAVKYNRAGGTVAVACRRPSVTTVRIDVIDTGPGIPTEQLDRLFTPFDRLGAEATTVEGTGIGLALSQRLATAMGGRITVTSTLGRGSTFSVELPRVEGPVARYERLDEDRPAADPHPAAPRVLVLHIEDNLSNVRLVERVFAQRSGVEIVPAMQGRLALELAAEHRPALVLLDLHLPDIGGDEVLQRLRENPDTASIPVVVVSADATPRQIQRLLAAGASAYLTKPVNVSELLQLFDDLVPRRADLPDLVG